MARSLTVKHEEEASTNPLFTLFIAVAMVWLLLSAIGAATASTGADADAPVAPALDAR